MDLSRRAWILPAGQKNLGANLGGKWEILSVVDFPKSRPHFGSRIKSGLLGGGGEHYGALLSPRPHDPRTSSLPLALKKVSPTREGVMPESADSTKAKTMKTMIIIHGKWKTRVRYSREKDSNRFPWSVLFPPHPTPPSRLFLSARRQAIIYMSLSIIHWNNSAVFINKETASFLLVCVVKIL